MTDRVLVTGATGKTGRALVALLNEAGLPHRAASRGGAPPFDWARPETWAAALEDVASIYLVAPAAVADAPARMQAFLRLAMDQGARRFVLLSMASLPAGGPGAGQTHQWLIDNAPDWAVLCPSAFMQNFSEGPYLASIRDEDTFYSNTGEGRVPFISSDDIARAAFAALTAPAALNDAFTLTGDQAIAYDRVAELISQASGRRITHTQITTPQMAERLMARGLPQQTAAFLAVGYQTIAAGAQDRIADGFGALTGRAPISFETFAQANAEVWRRQPSGS
jgi:uncharacterized protein YbjT (DUF2867 family)